MRRILNAWSRNSISGNVGGRALAGAILRRICGLLSASLGTALMALWGTAVNAEEGLPADVFFNDSPLSLKTQNAIDLAFQRNYGGPRDAGLIGSVCSACLLSGFQGGRNALAAGGLSQLGVSLPGLDALSGGSQFFGQPPQPQSFFASFQDPLAAGGGFAPAIENALQVAGFGTGSNSPVNFGTSFLMGVDPIFSGGSAFGEFGGLVGSGLIPTGAVTRKAQRTALRAQGEAPAQLSTAEVRYLALAQHEVDALQRDDTLSALRAELNADQLLFLYNDPVFSYLTHELNEILQQIVITRPSYPLVSSLAQQIASYTVPPEDNAVLDTRYHQRLILVALSAQLDSEAREFLVSNPTLASPLADNATRQLQLVQQIAASPQAVAYQNDWANRFQTAFVNSAGFPPLSLELAQIFADFPAFHEYLQLNREVVDLLPSFANHPLVLQVGTLLTEVNADPTVAQSVAAAYQQFTSEVDALLANTTYKAEVERAYELLNGLVQADPAYALLRDTQYLSVLALDQLQRQIHDAVANCLAALGPSCDPHTDPQVLSILPSHNADNFNLLVTVGQFYELYTRFWYGFSQSQPFLDLQANSIARVQSSVADAVPQLVAARDRFVQNVRGIPRVSAAQSAVAALGLTLRTESAELDARLDRMEQLLPALRGGQ